MNFKELILDIIYPKKCIICKKDGEFLCHKCIKKIQFKKNQRCILCKKKSSCGKLCLKCSEQFYFQNTIFATSFKNKDIIKIVKTFKYKFVKEIGSDIGLILFNFLNEMQKNEKDLQVFLSTNPIIIPIPLHKKRLKWRGFNQSQIIAEFLSQKYKFEINNALIRQKNNKAQANLKKEERHYNTKDIFACNENLNKKNIILIDDVITTGSTMKYASKALKKAGAGNILALAFAGE